MNYLLFASLVIIAVFSTKISNKFGVPKLIIFVLIGLIAGSDVLNLVYFDDAQLTKSVADLLLIFIIFDGGFQTTKKNLHAVAGPALSLATLGVAVTAGILGIAIHLIFKLELIYSLMIGAIISSTDAAAVFMINRQHPIRKRIATTLNVESAVNDPMAIVLTMAFIQVLTGQTNSIWTLLLSILWQFAGGIAVGYLMRHVSTFLFDHLQSPNRGYYNVLIIGLMLAAYGLALLIGANGIIAIFFMGHWLGNANFSAKQGVSNFLQSLTTLSNIALFLMLGLLAFPRHFTNIWFEGVIVALILMFIARPIAVWLFTLPFKFSLKEKLVLAWGGIKGAVPIVLATYPAAYRLDENGIVFNIIFFAVFLSCIVQGMTLGPLARWLGLIDPPRPTSPYSVELHTTRKSDLDMFEIHVEPNAACIQKRIKDLALGNNVLISSIIRDQKLILPSGSEVIMPNDILFILTEGDKIEDINEKINAVAC